MKGYLPKLLSSSFDTTNPLFNFSHPLDIISYEDPGCKNSSCEILVRVQLRGGRPPAFPQNVRHKL